MRELLLDLGEHPVGVGVGLLLNHLLFVEGVLALGLPLALRFELKLLDLGLYFGSQAVAFCLGLGLHLTRHLLGLLHQPHFVEDLSSLLFCRQDQIFGVAFGFGHQAIPLLQNLYGLPKGGGQV